MRSFKALWLVSAFLLVQALNVEGQTSDWLSMDKGLRCDTLSFNGVNYVTIDTLTGVVYVTGPGINDGYCNDIGEVAQWNGVEWLPVGSGGLGATLISSAPTLYNNELIMTGPFIHASGNAPWSWINAWDGSDWDTIPGGPNRQVFDYLEYQEKLYAAGRFDYCGGVNTELACVYDGEAWEPLEAITGVQGNTYALCEYQGEVYIGGNMNFEDFNGDSIRHLTKWDGEHFRKVGQGFDYYPFGGVSDMAVLNDTLYIGGQMKLPGSNEYHWLVTFDGDSLRPANPMPNDEVHRLKVHNNAIYASGGFTEIGDVEAEHLARYDGVEWIAINADSAIRKDDIYMGFQYSTTFRDFEIMNDTLYACGGFYRMNQDTMRYVAKLNKNLTTDFPPPATNTEENEFESFNFNLYPNPSPGSLTFSWRQPAAGAVSYRITDARGRVVQHSPPAQYQSGKHEETLSLGQLSVGTYFIRLVTPSGVATKRWVRME